MFLALQTGFFVDGIFNIIAAIGHRRHADYWWIILLEGIVSTILAVVTFFWPNITLLFLIYLIAFWALLTGLLEVVQSVRLKGRFPKVIFFFGGILSIIFGLLLMFRPMFGLLTLILLLALYAILFGISIAVFAFKVRKAQDIYLREGD